VIFSPSEILPVAKSTGFKEDVIEKVLHLLNLLNTLNSHPFLKGKLALKGGSALNLFVFKIPRLKGNNQNGKYFAFYPGCNLLQRLW